MSLMGISLSALNAAQAGLTTTAHNISNASTAGYSRQQIVQTTQTGLSTGAGFFGQGTKIESVQRVYNSFLTSQVRSADAAKKEFETMQTELSQVDNLLSDATAGLSPALQNFFDGLQEVSNSPSSIPSRQSMLSYAETMVDRFHSMSQRLAEMRDGVNSQMAGSVSQINSLAAQVADMNRKILVAESNTGQPANDMRDLRDALVTQINQQVRVTETTQNDGTVNLFFGTGQPLVVGDSSYKLSLGVSPDDPKNKSLYSTVGDGIAPMAIPDDFITGGTLGGLLRFRNETLNSADNTLGLVAIGLATNINAQQTLGQDLDGKLGTELFKSSKLLPAVAKLDSTAHTTTGNLDVTVSDVSKLEADDYTLSYDGSNYTLIRDSDKSTVYHGASTPPDSLGMHFAISGTVSAGDRWLVQPTRFAAQDIQLAISDTRKIAAASPYSVKTDSGNTGTATLTNGAVLSTTGLDSNGDSIPDFSSVVLKYDATAKAFTYGSPAVSLPYDPATEASGKTITLSVPNISFTVSGTPNDGDFFTISTNTNGTADNRNMVPMAALQNAKNLINGSANYEYAYSQLVSSVGAQARDAEVGLSAQKSLLEQATSAQQGAAGVNLDEEAANLLRYQQAYQAAAKVMNVASTIFNEVLNVAKG